MKTKRKSDNQMPASFLQKVFDMLNEDSLNEIVSWNEDGKSFVIKNVNEFSEQVLPMYFKHSNLASFVRQLNMYDFHKCRNSGQKHVFQHPLFMQGRSDLLKNINRKVSENNWAVLPRSNFSHAELSPILQKLYQLHKRSITSDSKILGLEEKVAELTDQNEVLKKQLWESKERVKRVEEVLGMMANYLHLNRKEYREVDDYKAENEFVEEYEYTNGTNPLTNEEHLQDLKLSPLIPTSSLLNDDEKLDFLDI